MIFERMIMGFILTWSRALLWKANETMDSLDLLAREEEFKRLNKQLEKKSDSLIKQIENVMQKQDFFSEFSHSLSLNSHQSFKKHYCESISITPKHHTPVKSKKKEKITPSKFKQESKQCITAPNQGLKFKNGTHKECIKTPNQLDSLDSSDFDCAKENSGCANCANRAQIMCDCCSISKMNRINGDFEFLHAFVSVNVQEKILPQSFLKDRVSVESVCKFLASKVKLMQEQIDKLQTTIDKKASQCETHLTKLAELESERMTLLNRANNIKAESADVKAKNAYLHSKLDEKDRLYKEQRSETDKLTSEVKRLRSKNATLEAKSASYEETIESLKQQLENAKRTEKEFRDSTRSLSTSHQNAIQKLEVRAKTLTARIDKQTELIDNLRKQNAILATEGALKALEKEYCKYLSQDF